MRNLEKKGGDENKVEGNESVKTFEGVESVREGVQVAVGDSDSSEALEGLNGIERACLESMKEDFDRGIVTIDEGADIEDYKTALKQDETAGQSWESVQGRLVDQEGNATPLLKKAVALSQLTGDQEGKGACLVGVYTDGDLAIRQRSSEIVNVIKNRNGDLRLVYHPKAELEEGEQWAIDVEIVRAVKAAGYHVPADVHAPDLEMKGLVAASEAVTGKDYVASLNRMETRGAMLECDHYNDKVRVVYFYPSRDSAWVCNVYSHRRYFYLGAILWLRG